MQRPYVLIRHLLSGVSTSNQDLVDETLAKMSEYIALNPKKPEPIAYFIIDEHGHYQESSKDNAAAAAFFVSSEEAEKLTRPQKPENITIDE